MRADGEGGCAPDLDAVDRVLARPDVKAFYTIPTFHNPLGTTTSREHREGLRRDVLMMARDLTRAAEVLMEDTRRPQNFITAQAALRSMPQALIVQRDGTVVLAASNNKAILSDLPPDEAFDAANNGDPVLITVSERSQVRALMKLQGFDGYYLYATRFVAALLLSNWGDRHSCS